MQIQWLSEREPWKGFEYVYLEEGPYQQCVLEAGSEEALPFRAERMECSGRMHWRLTDIIGEHDGIGVECLSGSAAIASAFSRAFDEGVTITLVSGRTVGIGAYLARLGRRCDRVCCLTRLTHTASLQAPFTPVTRCSAPRHHAWTHCLHAQSQRCAAQ
jgi:Carboxyl transferase domain